MKSNEMKNYVIGFLLGFCLIFLLGASRTWYVDGHCQSSLSGVGWDGQVYLAITNTSTGKTLVRRFDKSDLARGEEITFDAISVNADGLTTNARK